MWDKGLVLFEAHSSWGKAADREVVNQSGFLSSSFASARPLNLQEITHQFPKGICKIISPFLFSWSPCIMDTSFLTHNLLRRFQHQFCHSMYSLWLALPSLDSSLPSFPATNASVELKPNPENLGRAIASFCRVSLGTLQLSFFIQTQIDIQCGYSKSTHPSLIPYYCQLGLFPLLGFCHLSCLVPIPCEVMYFIFFQQYPALAATYWH